MPKKYGGRIAKAGELQDSTRVIINRKVTTAGEMTVVGKNVRDVEPMPEPSNALRRGRSAASRSATPHGAPPPSERFVHQRIPVLAQPAQGTVAIVFLERYAPLTKHHIIIQSQQEYLNEWLPKRDHYLETIVELDGRKEREHCSICTKADVAWRCLDCFSAPEFCQQCCQEAHVRDPFHRVESWSSTHWTPSWLAQTGVKLHLGHGGAPCPSTKGLVEEWVDEPLETDEINLDNVASVDSTDPSSIQGSKITDEKIRTEKTKIFTIVDVSGVHRLAIEPCWCEQNALPLEDQLLAMRLFPASFKRIKTVFTFRVLTDYRIDNLECKTSPYHYYAKLRRLTSAISPHSVPVSVKRT